MNALFRKAMIVTILFPLTFSTVYAKPGWQGKGNMPLRGMLEQVDLTPEQQQEIKTIMQNYRAEAKVRPNRGAFHDAQMDILKAPEFDETQANALIDEKNNARKAWQLKKMQMMFDVYHSLTPEQQEKMDELLAQKQQKMLSKGQEKKAAKNKQ